MVRVSVAQRRKLNEGDKIAGRHGKKGDISMLVPVAEMHFQEDGTPIDNILNHRGVPRSMNIGQNNEKKLSPSRPSTSCRSVSEFVASKA